MPGIPFLGAIGSILGGIFKGAQGKKQQKMANAISPVNAVYNTSQYAQNQLGAVTNAYNGRMAGAANAEDNIQRNYANSVAGTQRNSMSGSQNLAVIAGLQGQSDQAANDLASKEAQNHQQLLSQLGYANQGMVAEGDKIYNDKLRNYNNDLNAKNALQSAAWKNKGNMVSDITDGITGLAGINLGGDSGMNNSTSYSAPQASNSMIPAMQNSTGYINPFIR